MMLADVPVELQLKVFKKMEAVPFARTYRTTKQISALFDSQAKTIYIPVSKTFELQFSWKLPHPRIHIGRKKYRVFKDPSVSKPAEDLSAKTSIFFKFQEFYLNNFQMPSRLFEECTYDGFIRDCLRTIKFTQFTTTDIRQFSKFRELLEFKRKKFLLGWPIYPDHYEDLSNIDEVECLEIPPFAMLDLFNNNATYIRSLSVHQIVETINIYTIHQLGKENTRLRKERCLIDH